MRSLIRFILQHQNFFLFFLLEGIAFSFLINHNAYHGATFFNFSAKFTGGFQKKVNDVTHYFDLKRENEEVLAENAFLKMELLNIEKRDSLLPSFLVDSSHKYTVLPARIINNSTAYRSNYIVISVGEKDSVGPGMGVVASAGVVGVVKAVSQHYSVVMPILNHQYRVSSRLTRSNYFGSLSWNGMDYRRAQLEAIEKHVPLFKNDTVVTSGYGHAFPAGIPVGVVEDFTTNPNEDFYKINVRLAVNFKTVSQVHVIQLNNREELETLIEQEFND